MREQRAQLVLLLEGSPSLCGRVEAALPRAWQMGRARASDETGLDLFPETCPLTAEQTLTDGWLPDCGSESARHPPAETWHDHAPERGRAGLAPPQGRVVDRRV